MDVTSYLLGKNAGGGSQPVLQSKEVEITENGTTNVVADSGYDGLSKVEVTTNVSGETSQYFNTTIQNYNTNTNETLVGQVMITHLPPIELNSSITELDYAFKYFRKLITGPQMDTHNIRYMRYMFQYCNYLNNVPIYDTSSVLDMTYMFQYCSRLTDESLDNILQMCINATLYLGVKTLVQLGFTASNYPASRIEALPHYQEFVNAGWTIGY